MRPCGRLAVPGAPENTAMSFQTGTQTAEELQLLKRWVTQTLCQLEKGKEWGKGGGGEEDRGERTVTRGWGEWGRSEAGRNGPQLSNSLADGTGASCPWPWPLLHLGDKGGTLPWTSGYGWWFTNPNYTSLKWSPLSDSPRISRVVLSEQTTIVKEASHQHLASGICPKALIQD